VTVFELHFVIPMRVPFVGCVTGCKRTNMRRTDFVSDFSDDRKMVLNENINFLGEYTYM
jgi:hypothetical protein